MVSEPDIGRVFTPLAWAMWLLEEAGAFAAWCDGATICDPTFGGGAFVTALFALAKRDGIAITPRMISRVFGCEIQRSDKWSVIERIEREYGLSLPSDNFFSGDVLSLAFDRQFDVVVGNPPWSNFSVLPVEMKIAWGDKYLEHGLVRSRKDVLLGASRADIATLVIKKVLDCNLHQGGRAAFFLPLSLFFNSGANDLFRPYPKSKHGYAVKELWDFADERIFPGIATRYGAATIAKSEEQEWPVPTHVRLNGEWIASATSCSDGRQGFWQRHEPGTVLLSSTPRIVVSENQQPRQGLNTCGANDVLMFVREAHQYKSLSGELVELDEEIVFPLIDRSLFSGRKSDQRYVLVAHDRWSGRPLSPKQLLSFPRSMAYLKSVRSRLEGRKGTMLNAHIKRGEWWALLGVGPYSFAPWKVVWEALGKSAFRPKVVAGRWQGNQALHAYCPCESETDAHRLADALKAPSVEAYLLASAMGGTLNWAQPGRVKKLFHFRVAQGTLF